MLGKKNILDLVFSWMLESLYFIMTSSWHETSLNVNFTAVLYTIETHIWKMLYTAFLVSLYFDSDPAYMK